jgi:hypothetical protein
MSSVAMPSQPPADDHQGNAPVYESTPSIAQVLRTSFRLTRLEAGQEAFEALLARYGTDRPDGDAGLAMPADFVSFLSEQEVAPPAMAVARFELAKATCLPGGPEPLSVRGLQSIPPRCLFLMRVCRHPAVRTMAFDGAVPRVLLDEYPRLACSGMLLLTPRDGEVLVMPLTQAERLLCDELVRPRDLFSLIVDLKTACGTPETFHRLLGLGVIVSN